jgi:gluconokinase
MPLIARRLSNRPGHFMPPALLQSQFDTLEEPGPDERPIVVPVAERPAAIVERIRAGLQI